MEHFIQLKDKCLDAEDNLVLGASIYTSCCATSVDKCMHTCSFCVRWGPWPLFFSRSLKERPSGQERGPRSVRLIEKKSVDCFSNQAKLLYFGTQMNKCKKIEG
jgi:hypothetical protein